MRSGYVIDGSTCVSREKWSNTDPRNFVDMNMEGQIYAGALTGASAAEICRTRDGEPIDGVQLVRGRFCQCPDSAPYFDQN